MFGWHWHSHWQEIQVGAHGGRFGDGKHGLPRSDRASAHVQREAGQVSFNFNSSSALLAFFFYILFTLQVLLDPPMAPPTPSVTMCKLSKPLTFFSFLQFTHKLSIITKEHKHHLTSC
jgi:hypothetical protein